MSYHLPMFPRSRRKRFDFQVLGIVIGGMAGFFVGGMIMLFEYDAAHAEGAYQGVMKDGEMLTVKQFCAGV